MCFLGIDLFAARIRFIRAFQPYRDAAAAQPAPPPPAAVALPAPAGPVGLPCMYGIISIGSHIMTSIIIETYYTSWDNRCDFAWII